MIGISNQLTRRDNRRESLFALFQSNPPQIVPIEMDQIENVIDHSQLPARSGAPSALANASALLHQAKRSTSLFIENDDLAVENRVFRFYRRGKFVKFREFAGEVVLVPRNQTNFAVLDK